MGIPCFLGGMSRGLLGRYSDIQIRQKRGEALKEADVVILAGKSCYLIVIMLSVKKYFLSSIFLKKLNK